MSSHLPSARFRVYAIRLDPAVLGSVKFRLANPDYVEGKECFYVGMTARSPEQRFAQHKAGYKANRYARQYGMELMPPTFTAINPRTCDQARRLERRIARRLRRKGYGVWQN
jgi:predicted GIY-YIG superfamily endonuclease